MDKSRAGLDGKYNRQAGSTESDASSGEETLPPMRADSRVGLSRGQRIIRETVESIANESLGEVKKE